MNYSEGSVISRHAVLTYYKAGHGPDILLAFHGFGQDHHVFDRLAASLADRYTTYAFDLFFHGKSVWHPGEKPLDKRVWKEIFSLFLAQNNIGRYALTGFSIGARFALATAEAFPGRVNHLFLLAPDGISPSIWYTLATRPFVLRRFFRSLITHPQRFTALTKLAHRLALVDRGMLRFAEKQMNTIEKRQRVYLSWVVFRHLHFDMKALAHILNKHAIGLTLVAGRHDRVIPPATMNRLLKRLKKVDSQILNAGHNDLIRHAARFFS